MVKDIFLLLPLKLLQAFACDSRASLISFSSHLLAEGNSKFLVHLVEKLWRLWFAQQNLSQALSPAHANFLRALPWRYKQNHITTFMASPVPVKILVGIWHWLNLWPVCWSQNSCRIVFPLLQCLFSGFKAIL